MGMAAADGLMGSLWESSSWSRGPVSALTTFPNSNFNLMTVGEQPETVQMCSRAMSETDKSGLLKRLKVRYILESWAIYDIDIVQYIESVVQVDPCLVSTG